MLSVCLVSATGGCAFGPLWVEMRTAASYPRGRIVQSHIAPGATRRQSPKLIIGRDASLHYLAGKPLSQLIRPRPSQTPLDSLVCTVGSRPDFRLLVAVRTIFFQPHGTWERQPTFLLETTWFLVETKDQPDIFGLLQPIVLRMRTMIPFSLNAMYIRIRFVRNRISGCSRDVYCGVRTQRGLGKGMLRERLFDSVCAPCLVHSAV